MTLGRCSFWFSTKIHGHQPTVDLAQIMYKVSMIPYDVKEVKNPKADGFNHTHTEVSLNVLVLVLFVKIGVSKYE